MNTSARTEKESVPVVSVRLVSADYYMSSPIPGLDFGYSTYRGLEIKKVPVIRIFGSTSTGLYRKFLLLNELHDCFRLFLLF
jgi:hypothetical protein